MNVMNLSFNSKIFQFFNASSYFLVSFFVFFYFFIFYNFLSGISDNYFFCNMLNADISFLSFFSIIWHVPVSSPIFEKRITCYSVFTRIMKEQTRNWSFLTQKVFGEKRVGQFKAIYQLYCKSFFSARRQKFSTNMCLNIIDPQK